MFERFALRVQPILKGAAPLEDRRKWLVVDCLAGEVQIPFRSGAQFTRTVELAAGNVETAVAQFLANV
jgi:hypothetical protein